MTQLVKTPAEGLEVLELAKRAVASWQAGRSPRTVRARELDLQAFARNLELSEHEPPAVVVWIAHAGPVVTRERVMGWRAAMEAAGLAASTVARRLSTVQSLVRELGEYHLPWALRVRLPKVDPYNNAQGPAADTVEAAIDELEQLAEAEPAAARDRAVIVLLYDLALRVSSVAGIRFCDFDPQRPAVRVQVKGGRVQWRTLSQRALAAVLTWLRHRDALLAEALGVGELDATLRPSKQSIWWSFAGRGGVGPGLTADGVAQITRRAELGGPHGLRHAAATKLAESGNVLLVQALLGHASIQTSQVYMDQIRDDAGRASRILAGEEQA